MNYNKVFLAGNITRAIELAYTSSQTPIAKFGLAINKKCGDKEKVCFIDCAAFGKTAETIHKYCGKGDPLFIEGELEYETWTAKDGAKKNKHTITVSAFQFLKPSAKRETQQKQQDIEF